MAARERDEQGPEGVGHGRDRKTPDAESFEELAADNLPWLHGWLSARLRGRDGQEVDDLCQDIILRALRGYPRLKRRDRFRPWLYRIANNVLRDHIRRAARHRQLGTSADHELDSVASKERGVSVALDTQEQLENALDAVLDLPAKYREPILLRHLDELSYLEISEMLRISENAVQVRIFRAREQLRRSQAYRALYSRSEKSRPTGGANSRGERRLDGAPDDARDGGGRVERRCKDGGKPLWSGRHFNGMEST